MGSFICSPFLSVLVTLIMLGKHRALQHYYVLGVKKPYVSVCIHYMSHPSNHSWISLSLSQLSQLVLLVWNVFYTFPSII